MTTVERPERIVVVGASLAGTTMVDALRRHGFDGHLTLLGAEPVAAYNRPALSKGILTGKDLPEQIALAPLSCEVDQHLGVRASGIDLTHHQVLLADGERVGFDKLAIATGGRARTLADFGAAEPGMREVTVRELEDALALARLLDDRPQVVIVGAGILGMELASACLDRGAQVTVVDQQPPLLRQLGPYLADLLTDAATTRGVTFAHPPAGVRLRGSTYPPTVELADGRRYEGDLVISAVGCLPNDEWLTSTGLTPGSGVPVDERCRWGPDVVAAGDVAAFFTPGGHRRTPWWNSALEQAQAAALALLHGDASPPLRPLPFFWTEQFGTAIRVSGRLPVAGHPNVVAGADAASGLLLHWPGDRHDSTAAAVNRRVPITRLRALAQT